MLAPPTWPLDDRTVLSEIPRRTDAGAHPEIGGALVALAAALWLGLRRLSVWVADGVRPPRPGTSVDREAAAAISRVAPALEPALRALRTLRENPGGIGADEAARACEEVATWAEASGVPVTAVLYAEAAAAVDPTSARLANNAGRLCRSGGHAARAEVWYERAIGLARTAGNTLEYIRGYLGWGNLLRDQGEYHRARARIKRAAMQAKRAGLKSRAAEALHDVFTIELLMENHPRAAVIAKRALSVYPRHHRRYPYLAADFTALLVRRGLYAEAVAILSALQRKVTTPGDRLHVRGLTAWATAGAGDAAGFVGAAHEVRTGALLHPRTAPGALYAVGEGARLLGDWSLARRCAAESKAAAHRDGDVLTAAHARRLEMLAEGRVAGRPALAEADATGALLRRLSREVLVRLERWRGPTWRPRRHAE